MKTVRFIMKFVLPWLLAGSVQAAEPLEDEDFFLDDDTRAVNEGHLVFIDADSNGEAHAHSTTITLTDSSLRNGWAVLEQCHENIDPVSAAQVVYKPGKVRRLEVVSTAAIGRAWVEGHSVQLEDISTAARLCVRAESRVVESKSAGRFVVRNGPFMRRFLDGYYPMHVTLDIRLPGGDWVLEKSTPVAQPGFSVTVRPDGVLADAWFEGELETAFHFVAADGR